jgi:inward rectifier potassium channel
LAAKAANLTKAAKKKQPRAQKRTHVVRVGARDVETRGLADGFWTDLYHRALTVYWPVFFGSAAAIFIVLNAVFAFLFWLGDAPIANTNPAIPLPLNLFYFSIETLATVGYGDMHPQTNYGHLVATVEIFTGMSFLAVMTGLIFARFSRPRARFMFAHHPIVGPHLGGQTLMIRVANERHNAISQATARLWLLRLEDVDGGAKLRRFYELKLERSEHPMFSLSWTIFHAIDKASPLHGVTADDLARTEAALILNLSGVDDNSAQHLHARRIYPHRDIRWNHRYRDITSHSDEGRLLIDYSLFHDVTQDEV